MRSTDCIAIAPPYLAILFKKVVFEKRFHGLCVETCNFIAVKLLLAPR